MTLYHLLRAIALRILDSSGHGPDAEPGAGMTRRPTRDELRAEGDLHSNPNADFCPADFGDYCPVCDAEDHARARRDFDDWVDSIEADRAYQDAEQARAQAAEYDGRTDGWYLDLLAQVGWEGGAL